MVIAFIKMDYQFEDKDYIMTTTDTKKIQSSLIKQNLFWIQLGLIAQLIFLCRILFVLKKNKISRIQKIRITLT